MHTHMNGPNSSLEWVLSHWAHFTVVRFISVYVLLHVCVVLCNTVTWTWWDWSLSLGLLLPSMLWHCRLGHLTRKNPSPILSIMCLVAQWDVKSYSINQSCNWFSQCPFHLSVSPQHFLTWGQCFEFLSASVRNLSPCDLELWPWYLDSVKINQLAKYQGQRSFHSKVVVWTRKHVRTHTHTHTHTHTQRYFTRPLKWSALMLWWSWWSCNACSITSDSCISGTGSVTRRVAPTWMNYRIRQKKVGL